MSGPRQPASCTSSVGWALATQLTEPHSSPAVSLAVFPVVLAPTPSSQGIQPWAENRTASQELGVWVAALGTNSDTGGVGIAVVGGWREEMSVCGLCLTREMLFPMCQGVSVPLCLQLCPARPQLTLSWYPQEVVVSQPRCSDPCRMGPPWAEHPRAELGLS